MKPIDVLAYVRRSVLQIAFFSAVGNILLLLLPIYMLQVYDRVLTASSIDTLIYISLIVIAGLVTLGVIEFARSQFANRVAARIDVETAPVLFMTAMNGPRASLGDVQPLRDLSTIRSFISSRTLFFLFDLPFAPLFMIVLYLVHPLICVLCLVGAALMFLIAIANQRATGKSGQQAAETLNGTMTTAQTYARNFETIQALGMVGNVMNGWGRRFADALRDTDSTMTRNGVYGTLSRTLRLIIQMGVLGVGAFLVLSGNMTAGMIFASSMVSGRALQPLDQIVGAWRQVADARAAWTRIEAALKANANSKEKHLSLPTPAGTLSLEQVIYYPPNAKPGTRALIKGATLIIAAGETVAIIGPSQAGKSTLARAIVGAIRPHSGVVRIDGADIATWDPDELGRHVGYLSQEVELLPGTIAQNIARFDAEPDESEILAAAQRAMVHDLVLAQKDGYATEIGPGGVRLSGGERQRIGLARAFYGNPRLIVLDEPNANLDSDGEAALERALVHAKEQKATVLIITHRPSIASRCDKVIYMKGGAIELFGPAAEVMERLGQGGRPAQPQPAQPPRPAQPAQPQPVAGTIPEGVRMSPGVVMLQPPQQRGK